jgi:hypothetical protein
MFVFTRRVPFGGVWGWHAGLGHPILKLFGLLLALVATVVLAVFALLALVIDIILLPFRLLL